MKRFIMFFTNILILMSIFLGSIYLVTNDVNFYIKQYEKNNTTAVTKMSIEDLNGATVTLIEYLNDDRDNLNFKGIVNNESREIFDEREKAHMVDVKVLFLLLERTLLVMITTVLICILFICFNYKKDGIKMLGSNFWKSSLLFFVIVGILSMVFVTNFDWFWTKFHEVIFTNDLWLLDPNVSIMINMFPLNFFYNCVFRIVGIFVGTVALLLGLNITSKKYLLK